jgi:hypothetical protein
MKIYLFKLLVFTSRHRCEKLKNRITHTRFNCYLVASGFADTRRVGHIEHMAVGQRTEREIIYFPSWKMFTFGRAVVGKFLGMREELRQCVQQRRIPVQRSSMFQLYPKVGNGLTETLLTIHRAS